MPTQPIKALVISSDYQSALLVANKFKEIAKRLGVDIEVDSVLCIPDDRIVTGNPDFTAYDVLATDNTILRYDSTKGLEVVGRLNLARYTIPQRVVHQFWRKDKNPLGIGEAEQIAKRGLSKVLKRTLL